MTVQNRPKPSTRVANAEAKARALEQLALGRQVSSVARDLDVRRATVREWRDSPDGRAFLSAEREKRRASFAKAQMLAEAVLRDAAVSAANALVEGLESTDSEERRRCAEAILDRVGLPKSQRIEGKVERRFNLSALSLEEKQQLREMVKRAKGT